MLRSNRDSKLMKDEQKDQSKNNVESGRDSAQVLVIVRVDRSRLLEPGNQAQNCDQGEVASEKSQLNQPKLSGQLDQENAQPVAKRNRRPVDRLDRDNLRRDRKDRNGKGEDNQEIAHVLYLLSSFLCGPRCSSLAGYIK